MFLFFNQVSYGALAPNGVPKMVYMVNGTVPGPVLEATVGDTLSVTVVNESPSSFTVHWHGYKNVLSLSHVVLSYVI
jgi:FtsP/CotA-like multicopper oxidase with cupredoxin domain